MQVVTLDGFGLPRCKLLKVDVEGMEKAVLEGAAQFMCGCGRCFMLKTTGRKNRRS